MSRRTKIALVLMCLLAVLNAVGLILNLSGSPRAAVAGLSYQDLVGDPDFARAVQSIVQECQVNVDIARLRCSPAPK